MIRLSELEGAVLGFIRATGGCTAYAVRKALAESRSSHFSSSAGSVYPLLKRLEKRGFIRTQRTKRSGAGSRLCRLSADGEAALRRWVVPPVTGNMAAVSLDPIRTRVLFLDLVTPSQRKRFLKQAENALSAEIDTARHDLKQKKAAGSRWEVYATEGALAVLRARRHWIRGLVQQLIEHP